MIASTVEVRPTCVVKNSSQICWSKENDSDSIECKERNHLVNAKDSSCTEIDEVEDIFIERDFLREIY